MIELGIILYIKIMTANLNHHHDVTVIGAGWSGLVACKSMLEEGLSVVAIEKREGIGGVWRYSDDPSVPTVMKSTCCTSSTTVTEMSDFPMPKEIGMFPHNIDVREYLESYAENFNLMPHIQLNTSVSAVKKEGEKWHVTSSTGDTYTSTYLIVATGTHQTPNRELEKTTLKGYTGKIYHASEIKATLEEHKNERLLLLGEGKLPVTSAWSGLIMSNSHIGASPEANTSFGSMPRLFPGASRMHWIRHRQG